MLTEDHRHMNSMTVYCPYSGGVFPLQEIKHFQSMCLPLFQSWCTGRHIINLLCPVQNPQDRVGTQNKSFNELQKLAISGDCMETMKRGGL